MKILLDDADIEEIHAAARWGLLAIPGSSRNWCLRCVTGLETLTARWA
jgi:hypothetical protein